LQKEVESRGFNVYPYITRCALDIICGELWAKGKSHNFLGLECKVCLITHCKIQGSESGEY
jgi:hypothetical protein